MKIKCMITDDEPMARKGLRGYIERIDFLSLVGECEDAIQLNTMLKTKQVDLVFLDIEMPEMTGLELLSNLTTHSPKVIIVSAYEQYALKGYEFDVVDYLLKPVSFDRFLKSVNRVHTLLQTEQENKDYIFVKSDKQLKKIMFNDILFIESMENYVIIQTLSSKEVVYTTLKQLYESLPQSIFLQTHRSYLVNIEKVIAIDGNQLITASYKIPIARNFRDRVLSLILKN